MKIQYVSDLHLEGADINILNKDKADLLILAGDITTAKSFPSHYDFFKRCSDNFKTVVHICGNHEYYRGDIEETQQTLFEFFYKHFKNIHSLQNESINLGSYRLFGTTLWTDCNGNDPLTKFTLSKGMNDFRIIQWKSRQHWKLRPEDAVELHQKAVDALIRCLDSTDKPVIVVSHHAPHIKSINAKYVHDYHMNGGYWSDLDWIMQGYDIPLWFHGHMHDSVDYTVNKTRVLSNPRGYMLEGRDGKRYTENEQFDPTKTVMIGE
jgi:Icc-related predicted phosphoesterase